MSLVLVISGLVPIVSSVLHWWVSFSFFTGSSLYDGGDQVTMIATLLVIPVVASAPWRWGYRQPLTRPSPRLREVGNLALILLSIQVFVLYFQAAVSKFGVAQWVDGTAMWYLLNEPTFGVGVDRIEPLAGVLSNPIAIAVISWMPIAFELSIAFSQFGSSRNRRLVIAIAGLLHAAIALVMGIVSFSIAMVGVVTICAARGDRTLQDRTVSFGDARSEGLNLGGLRV